ncbi:DUF3141 domain-containing protein [Phytopseudomonas dryadis]|uniref:Poly(3-hydroxyalkanoate) synthetase n=1 Tax=Phytopseudomonas dryadis TaxID=2487520 RepID=A0ABY1ZBW4_9GAMM|nr:MULTISPECIES: DUF3141 domain-containing protein [Pseudomonas]TBV08190.1 poly(3-hydroxyalkanoate) synthetase [Pseudomonas dryadis]TBV19808.1 poly(3-hydroxyalkanoate) synthetase [Pseudomonas sp. FRB 230]
MSQESFFAKQEDHYASYQGLLRHMGELQRLHVQILLDALRQRQEHILAPIRAGQLRQPSASDCWEYLVDFGQRSLLFLDTLRQRGDNTLAHERAGYPLLLKFDHEVLIDGHDLPHPANYSLLRILPGPNQPSDDSRQPVIIVDPRGGHGAGIGGFKEDSEIGESLRAGHPTYFIAFSHFPAPGQTLADIAEAEAHFIEAVRARHPDTGKPVIIGNCQAGWALMGLAAARPELPGLVIINGAPLSYWAGVNGSNPMRYAGGLLGGSWMTRLGSDLGNGRFDGAWLVSNFESLNPANTHWSKYYNLFSQVDSEAPRFLDFERWWGSPTLLNSEEIEAIVDDLFIGNRLAGGFGRKSSAIDLKRIEAPVVVFCSYGDNITPPQQALNWIVDVYPSDLALRSAGRTIVYLRHASIGHLGIFVSGKVARREHRELLGAIDSIGALPAGLYELVIDDLPETAEDGQTYQVHFERRRIADILSHDQDGRDDEREFALVDRLSELNSTLYDWFVRPTMRQLINEPTAEVIRKAHPFHQQQVLWSSLNPALWWLAGTAGQVRGNRRPVAADNPLLTWQALFSHLVEAQLDGYRDLRDALQELCFHGFYGGLSTLTGGQKPQNPQKRASVQDQALIARLHDALPHGGQLEALARILFLLGSTSQSISKERIERLAQHGRQLVQQFALDPIALRDSVRLQGLLVFAHAAESLSSLPLLLRTASERQQVLDAVIQLVPELHTAEGAVGDLWRELHRLLERPLPGFVLTPDEPAATDAAAAAKPTAPADATAPAAADSVRARAASRAAAPARRASSPGKTTKAADSGKAPGKTAGKPAPATARTGPGKAATGKATAEASTPLDGEPAAGAPAAKPAPNAAAARKRKRPANDPAGSSE